MKVIHSILDPIHETLPHIIYEFGSDKVTALLSFNYERTIGFCHVCGLLEHAATGYGGPPDLLQVQVLRDSPQAQNGGGFSFGFGSGATSGAFQMVSATSTKPRVSNSNPCSSQSRVRIFELGQ
ncbi:hypothetical protein ACLB2K_055422 [Fragaria x ananassa]